MRRQAVITLITAALLVITLAAGDVLAQPAPPPPPAPAEPPAATSEALKIAKEIYYYQSEALRRRDPFMSIIAIRDEEKNQEKEAPPLQKFDLSQMKLNAVVLTQSQQYAMILLPDGKHYTVVRGDRVGIHDGYIESMSLSTVTVIESIKDYKGQIIKKEFLLRLRDEEEE